MGRANQQNTNVENPFKRGTGTSYPQEAFYYYIKQIDPTAINRDDIQGQEVDIHIPSLNVGIEYDGVYYHSGKRAHEKELRKNKILKDYGITLIRVKEQETDSDEIIFDEIDGIPTFTYSLGKENKYLDKVIVKVITYIFGDCPIFVNHSSDHIKIRESYWQNLAEMSLAVTYPDIAREWHPTKNGKLKPTEVYPGSDYRAWWICELGHEWNTKVGERTRGTGCPYCAGRKVLTGFNDVQTVHPELADEWHPTKNGNLKPTDVTFGSQKKVWWLCKYGHEWEASILGRRRGNGCPICAGQKVLAWFNDLQTKNPDLAKEWHPTKNGNLKPTDVTVSSGRKVWWICKHGHEWQATVADRTTGYGCPVCDRKKVLAGFNDLQTKNPKLAKEWHPTKNGDLKPTDVTASSHKIVWWMCKHGHEWQTSAHSRATGHGCPICSGKKVLTGFNDLQTKNPELAKEWHPTKNGNLKPTDVTACSNRKVWWLGICGHEWEVRVTNRAVGNRCPYCSGNKVLVGFNDLQTKNPELAKEWHPTKNGDLKPTDVTSGSHKKVWWMCKSGHEWISTIKDRVQGNGCPFCAGQKILVGFNDLQTLNPELSKEWHPTKNGELKPTDVRPGSNRKVWWICKHGHEWKTAVYERTRGRGCPECLRQKRLAGGNDLQTKHPELAKEWHPTKNGDLKPTDISASSGKKVWWICDHGHEWQATVSNRATGSGCPICAGRKVLAGFNDLQTKRPDIAKEWHPKKNGDLKPTEVTVSSGRLVWWICEKGHEWQATIANRTRGSSCPECRKLNRKKNVKK